MLFERCRLGRAFLDQERLVSIYFGGREGIGGFLRVVAEGIVADIGFIQFGCLELDGFQLGAAVEGVFTDFFNMGPDNE